MLNDIDQLRFANERLVDLLFTREELLRKCLKYWTADMIRRDPKLFEMIKAVLHTGF
jgi:hypothetical protein